MVQTLNHGIDIDSWYRHGIDIDNLLTTPMILTPTHIFIYNDDNDNDED